jgi:6-phosphogluconolactonase
MGAAKLISFPTDDALATAAAMAWVSAVGQARAAGRKFRVALSGGRITKKLFAVIVSEAIRQPGMLEPVEFFWADERCVPPDDPESNFLLADELLFKAAGIRSPSIHRIQGELDSAQAARLATADLRQSCGSIAGQPVLDLVLLGMGEDGHVASLFPGHDDVLADEESVFRPVYDSPKPPPQRVTLGLGAICAAHEVWVLASGKGKEAALRNSLQPDGTTPLARVIQLRANTMVFNDLQLV